MKQVTITCDKQDCKKEILPNTGGMITFSNRQTVVNIDLCQEHMDIVIQKISSWLSGGKNEKPS